MKPLQLTSLLVLSLFATVGACSSSRTFDEQSGGTAGSGPTGSSAGAAGSQGAHAGSSSESGGSASQSGGASSENGGSGSNEAGRTSGAAGFADGGAGEGGTGPCEGEGCASCPGERACANGGCVALDGCCSDDECDNDYACLNGACSTETCREGFNGPCGGVCTKGCCSVNDCAELPNMSRSCSNAHQCVYACKANWGNCDGKDDNGCEVSLLVGKPSGKSVEDCGACGTTCDFTNGEPSNVECSTFANSCSAAECWATFAPIGDPTDEYAYDCALRRPRATLRRGDCSIGCTYDCDAGYKDCNGSASDGCETANADADQNCYADPFWAGVF